MSTNSLPRGARPSRVASPVVVMDRQAKDQIACKRCGRRYHQSHHKGTPTPEFCRDCRESDPWCVWEMSDLDHLGYPASLRYGEWWWDDLGYPASLGYGHLEEAVAS
jgi:hypothetical protein